MSPLWVLPLLVITLGAAVVARAVGGTAAVAKELAVRSAALRALGDEAAALRADAEAVATRAKQLTWRAEPLEIDK